VARTQFIGIRRQLASLISKKTLEELAHDTDMMRRRRKVDPMALFWTVVLGFGAGRERTLAGLRRLYEKSTGAALVPSAFYDRFTKPLAEFFRVVAAELIDTLDKTQVSYRGLLGSFRDVLLTDSTLIRLHELLERSFPACRTNHTKAAAKLHMVMSVKGKGPQSIKLTSGRQHDGPVLKVGRWVKDHLLLFDLGYFRYQLFDAIDGHGGYFISRLKENANPLILAVRGAEGDKADWVVGRRLREIIDRLRRDELDADVEVSFRRRCYLGTRSGASRQLRLVAVKNAQTGRYHLYITNIPAERLTARQVALVYGARWQIELLFKEMKSCYGLEEMPSRKRHIVETLLYASVITLLVSRRLLHAVQRKLAVRQRHVPEGRWGAIFATVAATVLDVLLMPARIGEVLERWVERMLLHEAADPNRGRLLLLQRVEAGARI